MDDMDDMDDMDNMDDMDDMDVWMVECKSLPDFVGWGRWSLFSHFC